MEPHNPLLHVRELCLRFFTQPSARSQAAASCEATDDPARPSQPIELPDRAQSPCRADSASEMAAAMRKEPSTAVSNKLEPSTCSGDSASIGASSTMMRADTAAALRCPTMCPDNSLKLLQHVNSPLKDEQQLLGPQPDSNGASVANGAENAAEDRQLLAPQLTSELDFLHLSLPAGVRFCLTGLSDKANMQELWRVLDTKPVIRDAAATARLIAQERVQQ